jgi:hypothetical protein
LAGLRRVDRAIGEKSVHGRLSLSSLEAAAGRWADDELLIDKSKSGLFKLGCLTGYFTAATLRVIPRA